MFLGPGGVVVIPWVVPPGRVMVVHDLVIDGGDLFAQEAMLPELMIDGLVVRPRIGIQPVPAPGPFLETLVPTRFVLENNAKSPRDIALRVTNTSVLGQIAVNVQITGWLSSLTNMGGSEL